MFRRSIAAAAAAVLTATLILAVAQPAQAGPPTSGSKWCTWGSHSVPSPIPGVDPRTYWRIGSKANPQITWEVWHYWMTERVTPSGNRYEESFVVDCHDNQFFTSYALPADPDLNSPMCVNAGGYTTVSGGQTYAYRFVGQRDSDRAARLSVVTNTYRYWHVEKLTAGLWQPSTWKLARCA